MTFFDEHVGKVVHEPGDAWFDRLAIAVVFVLLLALTFLAACTTQPEPVPAFSAAGASVAAERVEGFALHPAVVTWLEAGGVVAAGGQPFVFGQSHARGDRLEFEASHVAGSAVVWCGVSLRSGTPIADVWAHISYGGRHVAVPMVARQAVSVAFEARAPGARTALLTMDLAGGDVLNGQSAPPVYATYDFAAGELSKKSQPKPFTPSSRVPHDGNQTGGHWAYMGLNTLGELSLSEARALYYPVAGYGGVFYKPTGELVTEADFPKAVLDGGNASHWHRDTPTWIRYSDRGAPWKDKATMRGADLQHWSIHDGPALALSRWPWDMGLRRLVRAGA